MKRITRYVLTETLGPFLVGFLIYTSILLIQFLFRSAELIIQRGVPARRVGMMILLNMPHIVVITVPMALLFGILVAVTRMSADSEITAFRACGQSVFRLLKPILLLCSVVMLLNIYLMTSVLPRGNSALTRLLGDIITSSFVRQVEPRDFFNEWQGVLLYIFEMQPGDETWDGIFMSTELPNGKNKVNIAEKGRVRYDDERQSLILDLQAAVTHEIDFADSGDYEATKFESLREVVQDPLAVQKAQRGRAAKGLRSLTLPELRAKLKEPDLPDQFRNLTRVEIHKKFSFPAACLVFGVVGLGLGFTRQRGGGRTSGFALSIGVILLYYVLVSNGEEAARVGRVPAWFAMWLPNILLGAAGLVLLLRRNRDQPILGPLDRWFRHAGWRIIAGLRDRFRRLTRGSLTGKAGSPSRKDVVLRFAPIRLRFLYRLDRYVMRQFFWAFGLILVSLLTVFTVADLTEKVDDFLKNDVPLDVILGYYKYITFQNIYDLAPFAVLITTLAVFGILSRSNEVTAAKASGISVYRLAVPALLAALCIVGLQVVLQTWVLPSSNQKVGQLEDRIKGRKVVRSYRRADHNWLFGQGRYIYNYLHYDPDEQALHRLQVFEFDDKHRLVKRLFASKATYVGDGWRFDDAWTREFDGRQTLSFKRFDEPVIGAFPEKPEYFESELKRPEALSYGELKDHIAEIEASGQVVPDLKVELAKKLGFPAVCLVMAMVALPFSFRLGRKGALYGVGLGIILGMVFLSLYAFSTMLGETGSLPAAAAVWSPTIAFVLLALWVFLGVET